MKARIDYLQAAPTVINAMLGLEKYLRTTKLDESLVLLICLRASQINGCAYCVDMHWKDLKAVGESDQRLYGLDAWEESPYYAERERAALAWTEAVTNVRDGHVPDEVYEKVRQQFTEKDLADLTLAIAAINSWNRLNIAARTIPGTYQPAKTHELKKGA
ncbi:MAG TPA: carboxymuconolactone decarboxylase family protein [Candidatus Angelobacter sp.]|nr:carboxymuconolactone decarboxylase family protein [Candidatus Angelobacter sp.]